MEDISDFAFLIQPIAAVILNYLLLSLLMLQAGVCRKKTEEKGKRPQSFPCALAVGGEGHFFFHLFFHLIPVCLGHSSNIHGS